METGSASKMTLPKRKKPARMGVRESSVVRCPGHLKWVRGHCCAVAGRVPGRECWGRIEAHHVRTRGAGGGDEQVVPLCQGHHAQLDSPAWSSTRFERVYKIDMAGMAEDLWRVSPHGIRYRRDKGTEHA